MSHNIQHQFQGQFNQLSNPRSQFFQRANQLLRGNITAGAPTVNSLLGAQLAMGGSYKGSLEAARRQRRAIETRASEAANRGTNQLFVSSQGLANQALSGAQRAFEFQESQPGFFDYLAGPLGTVAGAALGGPVGAAIGGGIGGGLLGQQRQQNQPNPNINPNINISQGGLGRTPQSNQFGFNPNIYQGGLG